MPFLPKGFEWVVILIIVLLIFGPKNLPKLGNAIGKSVKGLRDGLGSKKKAEIEDAETKNQEVVVEDAEEVLKAPQSEAPMQSASAPASVPAQAEPTAVPADQPSAAVSESSTPKIKRTVVKKKVE